MLNITGFNHSNLRINNFSDSIKASYITFIFLCCEQTTKYVKIDIIQESQSTFAVPIALVKRQNVKVKFCVYKRKLNFVTIGDSPTIRDQYLSFSKQHKADICTKSDLTSYLYYFFF